MQMADGVGFVGVAISLGSYTALQAGMIAGQSYSYALLKIVASTCILFSLLDEFNLSLAVMQILWIVISLGGILRLYVIARRLRFTQEEVDFVAARLPYLRKHIARQFLDNGVWVTGRSGKVLTREDHAVEALIYIAQGEADVQLDGHVIGQCLGGDYVGEVTSLDAQPASATVTLTTPSRYFCIKTSRLRDMLRRTPELREALAVSFAGGTSDKLRTANAELRRRYVGFDTRDN